MIPIWIHEKGDIRSVTAMPHYNCTHSASLEYRTKTFWQTYSTPLQNHYWNPAQPVETIKEQMIFTSGSF